MSSPQRSTCPARHLLDQPLSWLAWVAVLATAIAAAQIPAGSQRVLMLELDGAIGPAQADYVVRGLATAAEADAALVILRMDTPGGLDSSMREIIRAILASPVPVASYVHPSGARAASAGTYILYASHIAAMSPGTNLGAATPVAIGGTPKPEADADDDVEQPAAPANASESKAINDAVAYIRSLAELRDRNADWAEQAVREAASLSAGSALEQEVIDIIARNPEDLLARVDGREVIVAEQARSLATAGLAIERLEPGWRTRVLATLTNPQVAIILMLIGVYGLIFEFMNPGALYPGTVGAICLIMGMYALTLLPLNHAGAALILLGIALMVAEAFAPSFGILGIGGAVSLALGLAILIDTDVPGFTVPLPFVAAIAALSLVATLAVMHLALTAHRRAVVTGREEMLGAHARVLEWSGGQGYVLAHGERWHAVSPAHLTVGQTVQITRIEGLTLHVHEGDTP